MEQEILDFIKANGYGPEVTAVKVISPSTTAIFGKFNVNNVRGIQQVVREAFAKFDIMNVQFGNGLSVLVVKTSRD